MATRLPGRPLGTWPACVGPGASAPSPALSAATTAPQPLAPAVTSTAAAAVEAVVGRRALLVTNAAVDRPAGGEVNGGDHWQPLLDLELGGRVAGRRDKPVEGAGKRAVRGVCDGVRRREARGQAEACVHAHGARVLEPGGGCNGEPLTSGCRSKNRSASRSSCCHRLREGIGGRTSESTRDERLGLITSHTRLSICDGDRRSGMYEPAADMVPSLQLSPGVRAPICFSAPMA